MYEHDSLRRVLSESKADVLTTQPSELAIEEALKSLRRPPPGARFLSKSNFGVRIANGVHTASFPAVAALLHAPGGSFLRMACSATLVGSRTLLTAAHCVARDEDAQNYRAYFQHAGLVSVAEVAHPRGLYVYPAGDVAVVRLSEDVPGIAPLPINTLVEISPGTAGLLVGFGLSASTSADAGIKRIGLTTTAPCDCPPVGFPPCAPNDALVCWDFEIPIGARGDLSNTCTGDSGGPLFRELRSGGVHDVVGVTSGGASDICETTTKSFDASVFKYNEWILGAAGADYGTVSDKLPLVGTEQVMVHADEGRLAGPVRQLSYRVNVPANATQLRVAMNAQDRGRNEDAFAIFAAPVVIGSAGAASGCSVQGDLQFKSCAVQNPVPGDWDITVTKRRGSGLFQVVATIFTAQGS